MGNKSSNCSDKKINSDQNSMICKPTNLWAINQLYVTESSLAQGIAFLDKEMTQPVNIQVVSRLTPESE